MGVSDNFWFGAEARSVMPCFKPTCSFFHQYTITMPCHIHGTSNQNWQDCMQHRTCLRMKAQIVTLSQCTNQVCLSLRCIHILYHRSREVTTPLFLESFTAVGEIAMSDILLTHNKQAIISCPINPPVSKLLSLGLSPLRKLSRRSPFRPSLSVVLVKNRTGLAWRNIRSSFTRSNKLILSYHAFALDPGCLLPLPFS